MQTRRRKVRLFSVAHNYARDNCLSINRRVATQSSVVNRTNWVEWDASRSNGHWTSKCCLLIISSLGRFPFICFISFVMAKNRCACSTQWRLISSAVRRNCRLPSSLEFLFLSSFFYLIHFASVSIYSWSDELILLADANQFPFAFLSPTQSILLTSSKQRKTNRQFRSKCLANI